MSTRIRRSAGTGMAMAALVTAAITAGCSRNADSPTQPGAPSTGVAVPATQASHDELDHDREGVVGASPAPPSAAAQRTAEAFMRAWARPNVSAQVWLAGVRPFTVPNYGDMLASVDPANVPATSVLGAARPLLSSAERADFDVPTDAGDIRVTCVRDGQRWLVATVRMPERP